MASAQAVYLKSGDQPRAFDFGNAAAQVNTIIANQASLPIYKEAVYSTFQAILTGTGALTATVAIQASNDDNTGRGFVVGGASGPSNPVSTTNASSTLTSLAAQFTQALVGATISAPGVPVGTTVSSVTNPTTIVMSANATATATSVQCIFYANNWIATALGTITLSGSTNVTDGFSTASAWRYVRANVTAISGTGATVSVVMGV